MPHDTHAQGHAVDLAHLPKSNGSATMQPISHSLDVSLLVGATTGGAPLDLKGSDGHLEVIIEPGSLDFSHTAPGQGSSTSHPATATPTATTTPTATATPSATPTSAPSGPYTLQVSQLKGHFAAEMNLLGTYQLQVLDARGKPVSGIRLTSPFTIIYHYQPAELLALDLDPSGVLVSWTGLLSAARAAGQPTTGLVIPLAYDPKAQTFSGQSTVLGPGPLVIGGPTANQSPPIPILASVLGNSGQLGLSYPLSLPPNARGFIPSLSLSYSSADTNQRTTPTSPADMVGDGWSLGIGSITAAEYPSGGSASDGTWYFLSGAGNISDRLVPDTQAGFYQTEHISRLRIQQVTSGDTGQPCFQVYDTSGTYYDFGCHTDSLQYWTDQSTGTRHNYRWDLDKIISPNEGPTAQREFIYFSYLQDCSPCTTNPTIRSSAIQQIVYGQHLPDKTQETIAGTVDFTYHAPYDHAPWTTKYPTNYNCFQAPPDGQTTPLRCDDPLDKGTVKHPLVMSTYTLDTITSYVGDDSSSSHAAYRYDFTYQDYPFYDCTDPYTLVSEYCAGKHLLTSVTPSVYQNGTRHQLKAVTMSYTRLDDHYYDGDNKTQNGSQQYGVSLTWHYLSSYQDSNSGVGEHISYLEAYNNTHGTPYVTDSGGTIIDDRHDPLYCTIHANDSDTSKRCQGHYDHPNDHAWSVQVVTQITAWGSDSSALAPTTTTYHYRLGAYGTYNGNGDGFCYPAGSSPYLPGQTDCTFNTWIPGNSGTQDSDWRDYYHGEFRGFQTVYRTSPAGDLTADNYFSSEGWATPESNGGNYNSGFLFEQDVYSGNSTSGPLLSKTVNKYTGSGPYNNACNGLLNIVYAPCEVMVMYSTTTFLEGAGSSSAPQVTTTNQYDDYDPTNGLQSGYHNLLQQDITSSNAPTLTRKWTYSINNQTVNGTVYYTVNKVTHSEIDDSGGHTWACQDATYDEGVASGVPVPDAGWPTTIKTYSTCGNSSTAITTYSGYDAYGNPVASVDGVGTANSSLYTSSGCTLGTAPVYKSSGWSRTHYTSCSVYDSYNAQPTSSTNALSQTGTIVYDYTQGSLPVSATDPNSQVTTTSFSYDSSGNRTVSEKAPLESGSYTLQSNTNSQCNSTSTLPCFEIDSKSILYPNAITRTFYDSLGRKVETRTTGPDAGHDTIVFTSYNDAQHTVFTSVPFEVNSGSSWIDPNTARDYNNVVPGGTVTYLDALGRPIASDDPLLGSSQEPGITCPAASGHHTTCAAYGLGSANGDTATYDYAEAIDPNNHVSVGFVDALNRTRYTQDYSGLGLSSLSSNIVQQKATQYNALNEPISVITTDLAPQSGQTITSVIASATYDDLGRMTALGDPDRGTHSYSYDANGQLLSDVSGTRTIGTNYDLLGRVGCIQDAAPVINATGACTSGTHPYVQNTYDTTILGTRGTTDFPVGQLTQSVATTYYPDSTSATVTEQFQHDKRGRSITATMQLTWPGSWGVTTPLPTYQVTTGYNDADQPTTTTTSTNPTGQGYTTTNVYDSTTGALIGLSNTGNATANVATLTLFPACPDQHAHLSHDRQHRALE